MKTWAIDLAVSFGLALLIVLILLFSGFDSTFIYRGF